MGDLAELLMRYGYGQQDPGPDETYDTRNVLDTMQKRAPTLLNRLAGAIPQNHGLPSETTYGPFGEEYKVDYVSKGPSLAGILQGGLDTAGRWLGGNPEVGRDTLAPLGAAPMASLVGRPMRPVTAYHGTLGDFRRLDPAMAHAAHSNSDDPFAAVHLTSSLGTAKMHAHADNPYSTQGRIIVADIDPEMLKTVDYAGLLRKQWRDEGNIGHFDPSTADAWIIPPGAVEAAKRQGYGGLTLRNGPQGSTEHAIWDAAAILNQRDLPRPW